MTFMERTLNILSSDGTKTPFNVKIYYPQKLETGDFGCQFSIMWPSRPQSSIMYGKDAVQSIITALNMVALFLYQSEFHKEGHLFLEKPGDGYGFPLSSAFKDLAQGSDKSL